MTQRSDAARNRTALLASARRVFSRDGAMAPLDLVLQDAGLARGTLYRHFPDRNALVSALLEERVTALEARVTFADRGGRLEELVRVFIDYLSDTPGLLTLLRSSDAGQRELLALRTRVGVVIGSALQSAHERGEVRPEVDVEDVLLVLAMLEGAMLNVSERDLPDRNERVLQLVLRTLSTEPRPAIG